MDFPQTLNINARTRVVLTKVGADVLNDYFRQYHLGITEQTKQWEEEHFPTTYKEGDVFETELHHIMHILKLKIQTCFHFHRNCFSNLKKIKF